MGNMGFSKKERREGKSRDNNQIGDPRSNQCTLGQEAGGWGRRERTGMNG